MTATAQLASADRAAGFSPDDEAIALLVVGCIIAGARVAGWAATKLGQPRVIGEMTAGILLGPTFLGDVSERLFPLETRPLLHLFSSVAVIVFVALVALEVDAHHIRLNAGAVAGVSIGAALAPVGLGTLLGLWLYQRHDPATDAVPFVLFVALALSITAVPVLSRILAELRLLDASIGSITVACAASVDGVTWLGVAVVVAMATAGPLSGVVVTFLVAAAMIVGAFAVLRPVLAAKLPGRTGIDVGAPVLALLFAAAFLGDAVGLHVVLGAFLVGFVLPRGAVAVELRRVLAPLSDLLLPVFFVTTGLNVDLRDVGPSALVDIAVVVSVATVSKIAGAGVAARACGAQGRDALAVGVLMNTRGLTELLVLDIGRSTGVLDTDVYSFLVVMALVTTFCTAPVVRWLRPRPDLPGFGRTAPIARPTAPVAIPGAGGSR